MKDEADGGYTGLEEVPEGFCDATVPVKEVRRPRVVTATPVTGPVVRELVEGELLPAEATQCLVQSGVNRDSALQVQGAFVELFSKADALVRQGEKIVVTDHRQRALMDEARRVRLQLRAVRCEGDRVRKALKEDSLKRGRAIDGVGNVLSGYIERTEAYLLEQEQFAERHEAKRVAELAEARAKLVQPYADVFAGGTGAFNLGDMGEEQFQVYLTGLRLQHEQKIEQARLAEAARLAQIEQARKDQEERTRLQAELDAKRREIEEQNRIAADNARVAREALDEERRRGAAELERVQREAAARVLAAENAERARQIAADAENKRLREAEERAEAMRLADAQRLAAAPDREKVLAFAALVAALKAPLLTTDKGLVLREVISGQIAGFSRWLTGQADKAL